MGFTCPAGNVRSHLSPNGGAPGHCVSGFQVAAPGSGSSGRSLGDEDVGAGESSRCPLADQLLCFWAGQHHTSRPRERLGRRWTEKQDKSQQNGQPAASAAYAGVRARGHMACV